MWEVLAQTHVINTRFLPSFSKVAITFFTQIVNPTFLYFVLLTMGRCLSGFIIASILGVLLGLLMGQSKKVYNLLNPLVEVLRPLPSSAIIPVAIMFLGIDNEMKIFVIIFACLWPILINSMDGARNIDSLIIDTAKTFDLNKKNMLFKIIIPASVPGIITGMRISLSMSLILAVTVEMLAGNNGLGFYILDMERSFRYPEMYAGVVFLGIFGFFLNYLFIKITTKIIKWQKGSMLNI
jgi:ABC-type nitrate/sulfonate/bicarbonate transport system permease component